MPAKVDDDGSCTKCCTLNASLEFIIGLKTRTIEESSTPKMSETRTRAKYLLNELSYKARKLADNTEGCEKAINAKFDGIVTEANQRRERLLADLKRLAKQKQSELTIKHSELNDVIDKRQRLRHAKCVMSEAEQLASNDVSVQFHFDDSALDAVSTAGTVNQVVPAPP